MNATAQSFDAQAQTLQARIGKRFSDRVLNLDPRLFGSMDVRELRVLQIWAKRYRERYSERESLLTRELLRRGATTPIDKFLSPSNHNANE